jgi:hypothetical protein
MEQQYRRNYISHKQLSVGMTANVKTSTHAQASSQVIPVKVMFLSTDTVLQLKRQNDGY